MNPTVDSKGQNHSPNGDDVIELTDIIVMFWRHRWLFLGSFVVPLLVAIVYLAAADPVYLSHTVIKIGHVNERKEPIEQAQELITRLELEHGSERTIAQRGPLMEPRVRNIAEFQTPSYVLITTEGREREATQEKASDVVLSVMQAHAEKHAKAIALREEHLAELERLLSMLLVQSELTSQERKEPLSRNLQLSGTELVVLERGSYQGIVELQESVLNRQAALEQIRGAPSTIHFEPSLAKGSVYPRRTLTLAFSLLISFALGTFVVTAWEFWVSNRSRFRK